MTSSNYRSLVAHAAPGRRGYTLVELIVALALVLFLMTILSEAFVAGAKVFRDFKAIGDLAGRLRAAAQILRDDLRTNHFDGSRRISDANFWGNAPPNQGFFRIWQQSAAVQDGGTGVTDLEGVASYVSTGTWLHFTVNKRGNSLKDFYVADMSQAPSNSLLLGITPPAPPIPLPGDPPLDSKYQDATVAGPVYRSQWAEVAWFLKPNGATAGTTPLYSLYRRCLPLVQNNYYLNWANDNQIAAPVSAASTTGYDDISYKTDSVPNFYFNCPADVTQPPRRFGMATQTVSAGPPPVFSTTLPASLATTDVAYGGLPIQSDGTYPISPNGYVESDVVLTDVISFDVRVLIAGQPDFTDLASLPANSFTNPAFSSVYVNGTAQQVYVYDTWSAVTDASYDYYNNWNLTYPATGTTAGTNATVPLRRLYNTTTAQYLTSDIQILAIQVSMRIWDFKTEQARQVTLIVDM